MADGVDPNRVILTGENPYVRLALSPDGELTSRTSLWKVIMSPAGPGNVLFIVSDLTEDMPRIYSDNIAMARWFQREIVFRQYEPFGDMTLDVIEAEFDKNGDVRSFWTERILTDDEEITLTWYDIQEPSMINPQPNSQPGRPHGVYACMIASAGARLALNGTPAIGKTFLASEHPGTQAMSSLAFSETWLLER